MDYIEKLASWMAELGPQLDLDEVTCGADGDLWVLVRDDATAMEVAYVAETGRLYLSSEVAAVPEAQRIALYETALQYNLLWMETGGLVLALDGAGGNLVLQFACGVDALEDGTLQARIEALFEQTGLWREVLANQAAAPAPTPEDFSRSGLPQGAIRV